MGDFFAVCGALLFFLVIVIILVAFVIAVIAVGVAGGIILAPYTPEIMQWFHALFLGLLDQIRELYAVIH